MLLLIVDQLVWFSSSGPNDKFVIINPIRIRILKGPELKLPRHPGPQQFFHEVIQTASEVTRVINRLKEKKMLMAEKEMAENMSFVSIATISFGLLF